MVRTAFAALAFLALCPGGPVVAQAATDLFLVSFHETAGRIVVDGVTRLTDRDGYDNQPHFLTDGEAVLYTSIDAAGQADIHRIDLTTLRATRVTNSAPESEYSATPMPGGARFSAIRVEADSAQRLWSFRLDGTDARPVIEGLRPIGYHAWVDSTLVVVFVLGDPATLRLVDPARGEASTLARDIGRAIQRIPGRRAVSFVQREGDAPGRIMSYDVGTGAVAPLINELEGNEYHAWTPSGVLVSARGATLVQWTPGDESWRDVADLASYGIGAISRLAVSPRGGRMVVVSAR
jgi:hypothetical protein